MNGTLSGRIFGEPFGSFGGGNTNPREASKCFNPWMDGLMIRCLKFRVVNQLSVIITCAPKRLNGPQSDKMNGEPK